jgi:hypothetical protein
MSGSRRQRSHHQFPGVCAPNARFYCLRRARVPWDQTPALRPLGVSVFRVRLGRHRRVRVPSPPRSAFAGFRFPPEVIVLAVRWYLRFGLSYRDVEELLAERGVEADHVTIYRWVRRFAPLLAEAARPCRHAVGARWFVDETYVKVGGGGGTCTGRSTSSATSSTYPCPPGATPTRRAGSSARRSRQPR